VINKRSNDLIVVATWSCALLGGQVVATNASSSVSQAVGTGIEIISLLMINLAYVLEVKKRRRIESGHQVG